MTECTLSVDGSDADSESLREWLRREPDLRGLVRTATAPAPEDAMGVLTELAVAIAAPGAVAALARSVAVWLTQRRSDVTIELTLPDGTKVVVDGRRVDRPEAYLRTVLGRYTDPPAPEADRDA